MDNFRRKIFRVLKITLVAGTVIVFGGVSAFATNDTANVVVGHKAPQVGVHGDIGIEAAKQTALSQVPGATESDIVNAKADVEKGVREYDVKIQLDGMEYEFEINGATGEIINSEKDAIDPSDLEDTDNDSDSNDTNDNEDDPDDATDDTVNNDDGDPTDDDDVSNDVDTSDDDDANETSDNDTNDDTNDDPDND